MRNIFPFLFLVFPVAFFILLYFYYIQRWKWPSLAKWLWRRPWRRCAGIGSGWGGASTQNGAASDTRSRRQPWQTPEALLPLPPPPALPRIVDLPSPSAAHALLFIIIIIIIISYFFYIFIFNADSTSRGTYVG
jgi:hypothetical protein